MVDNATRCHRRGALGLLLPAALAPAYLACAQGAFETSRAEPGSPAGRTGTSGAGLRVQAAIPGTDIAVGPNRFILGLVQPGRSLTEAVPLPEAQLQLKFFFPIEPQPVARGEAMPQFQYVGDNKNKGLYVAQVQFDQPGDWGVEITGTANGQALVPSRSRFVVKAKSDSPAIGSPAPRSRNLTRHDVDDIRKIDTGARPNDMHEVTIADAIDERKPLVIVFASPGFCTTQTCTPQLGEVQSLKATFDRQANFIHIEIYKDPMSRTPFETVSEWKLVSEPWVFMVDRAGLVAEKFEGPAPVSELRPALQRLL